MYTYYHIYKPGQSITALKQQEYLLDSTQHFIVKKLFKCNSPIPLTHQSYMMDLEGREPLALHWHCFFHIADQELRNSHHDNLFVNPIVKSIWPNSSSYFFILFYFERISEHFLVPFKHFSKYI